MTLGDTLRRLGRVADAATRTDDELLTRFVRDRDADAFADLLRKHGPTVYGVCRRVLGDEHDAADAFQAVWLVFVRKAGTIRPPGMVGNWLYGVAVRTAAKARVMNARRASRERERPEQRSTVAHAHAPGSPEPDTLAHIDAELAALPDKYRAAFVACDVNGRSRSEAAVELGWPEGTVAARQAQARRLLADRLRRRGVTLGAVALATVIVPSAVSAATLGLVEHLLIAGVIEPTPAVRQLTDEVLRTMIPTKPPVLVAAVVLLGLTVAAVVFAASGDPPQRQPLAKAPVPKEAAAKWQEAKPIEFADGGRVTGVAFAPSGKTFAVCRDGGRIDFFDPATRKHQQGMVLKHDPTVNANTEAGAFTVLAFRPTPHDKLGDVFAVTHKNGVNFGTTTVGLLADTAAAVEGVPGNWTVKDFDPHRVAWVKDEGGVERLFATNGAETRERHRVDGKTQLATVWKGWDTDKHKPVVLAADADRQRLLFTFNNGPDEAKDTFDISLMATQPRMTLQPLKGHKARPTCGVISKDGRRIVTADEGGTLIVREEGKGEFEEKRRIELGPGLVALALATDGNTVAALRADGVTILSRPARTGTMFSLFVFDVTASPKEPTALWKSDVLPGTFAGPASLAFSPDGNTLMAAFADPYPHDENEKGLVKSSGMHVWEKVPVR